MGIESELRSVFGQAYDRNNWLEILNESLPIKFFSQPLSIEEDGVESFIQLGTVTLVDGKTLGIYELQTKPGTKIHRNRVQMREIVAQQCRQSARDGALAVYLSASSPDRDGEQWRFSFVSVEYTLDADGRVATKESPSKRYTYLLGKGAQVRTVIERFSLLDKSSTLDDLLEAFSVEPLNKEFYEKLQVWYNRAQTQVHFPNDQNICHENHIQTSLIRLITRLLFIWFIREKKLVHPDLFDQSKLLDLIQWDEPSSYYKAILQNLFFATLNVEIDKRDFRDIHRFQGKNRDYGDQYRYRYHDMVVNRQQWRRVFEKTPFLNGGLFESLDRKLDAENPEDKDLIDSWHKEIRPEKLMVRMEGFSDRPSNPLCVPNALFFNGDDSDPGLIDLLKQYQFTLVESTPLDVEVALDPELLGKVFENLLAEFNPETQDTARKQTGSYYTPRNVVDYMVSEALVAALAERVQTADNDPDLLRDRLRCLFDYAETYNDAEEWFTEPERESIVSTIAQIKVLDPAVGSGAFPMGVLHKLTLALRRLDPTNEHWKQIQKDIAGQRAVEAFETDDKLERETELRDVSDAFEKYRDSDFGRKLYLIQNSIFGVDVQPVACQIAKLRFFISLAIEQDPDPDLENFGIRPLPNLETRFVAADTLVGLKASQVFTTSKGKKIEDKLAANRARYFHARTSEKKADCREIDSRLRSALAIELSRSGMPAGDAKNIADWAPFDQNAHANWFDTKYMFNIVRGFDLIIGNPPYVESRNSLLPDDKKNAYQSQLKVDWAATLPRGSDLLIYFYARAPKFLTKEGHGCFITQNAWLSTDYGGKFQEFSLKRFSFSRVIDTSARFFSDSKSQNINAVVTFFNKHLEDSIDYSIADKEMRIKHIKCIPAKSTMKWGHLFAMPRFFEDILVDLVAGSGRSRGIRFGQGLNFSKKILNLPNSDVPVIVNETTFVATSADGHISSTAVSRRNNIPALLMPRGVGNRFYCTFNECKSYSYSHVELYLPNSLWGTDVHFGLWAYLNSSFAWLFREITGRKNLGGGMLKAEATDMKNFPIDFDFDFADDAKEVLQNIRKREPLPVWDEIYTEEHLLLDDMVSEFFGFGDKQVRIRDTLLEQVYFRLGRSRMTE